MHKLVICVVLLAIAVGAGVAGAKPLGTNGQITFARFNPALGDTQLYVVNPDGTHERLVQGPTDTGECPKWFSDGAHIATCGSPAFGGGSRIIDPDDGSYRDVGGQEPDLFNPCGWPSPDGKLLLCETFSEDGSQNGLHVIRSSDGGGLRQITSVPGGDDVPGSWSPDGHRIVFHRFGPESDEGVFVVNVNGTGLKQILPPSALAGTAFDWSPQGNDIVFSRHVTPDVHSSIWIVHADGSGLSEVNVQPSTACGGANADPTADGCFSPGWSPDGTKIAFAKGQHGDVDANIYTVNVDGTGLTQVTHTGGSNGPDWGTHPLSG
jgi:Tol biopolymer transport system component